MVYLSLHPSSRCLTRAFHLYCNLKLVQAAVLHFPFLQSEGYRLPDAMLPSFELI
jgi:hypothetical protein